MQENYWQRLPSKDKQVITMEKFTAIKVGHGYRSTDTDAPTPLTKSTPIPTSPIQKDKKKPRFSLLR